MVAGLTTLVLLFGLAALCLLFALPTAGGADTPPPALPEWNTGLAAKHPGDAGIEEDPAVIFHEDFEDCRTTADLSRKWDVMYNGEHLSITEDPAHVNGGRRALEITMPKQHARSYAKKIQEAADRAEPGCNDATDHFRGHCGCK